MVVISSVIFLVCQLLRFWLAAAAAAVVVGALLQSLTEGHCDGHSSVSHLGRSASGCYWQTAVEPTLTVWAELWAEVWAEVLASQVEAEVRGLEAGGEAGWEGR